MFLLFLDHLIYFDVAKCKSLNTMTKRSLMCTPLVLESVNDSQSRRLNHQTFILHCCCQQVHPHSQWDPHPQLLKQWDLLPQLLKCQEVLAQFRKRLEVPAQWPMDRGDFQLRFCPLDVLDQLRVCPQGALVVWSSAPAAEPVGG